MSKELASVLSIRIAVLVIILAVVIPFLNYNFVDFSPDAWIQSTLPLLQLSCSNVTAAEANTTGKI